MGALLRPTPRNGSRNGGGAAGILKPRNGAARGQEPMHKQEATSNKQQATSNKQQATSNKKESEERKNGLGAQTMTVAK
jgi:hypothetical protein